jgi:hypothetical protein
MLMLKSVTKNHSIVHLYDKILTRRISIFSKVRKLPNKENFNLSVTRLTQILKTSGASMPLNLFRKKKLPNKSKSKKLKRKLITHSHSAYQASKNSLKFTSKGCRISPDVLAFCKNTSRTLLLTHRRIGMKASYQTKD